MRPLPLPLGDLVPFWGTHLEADLGFEPLGKRREEFAGGTSFRFGGPSRWGIHLEADLESHWSG